MKSKVAPLPQTINRKSIVLRAVLKHAATKAWITQPPPVPFLSETANVRDAGPQLAPPDADSMSSAREEQCREEGSCLAWFRVR
jgi:hypothetical protein